MSDAPDDRMSDLRQLFFESAGELVQKLNDEAMRLEVAPGDVETARSLRRTVHTLKGDAAACGFRELSELSHEFEDVLTLENTAAAASVPEIALRAADVFAALLEAYRTGTKLPNIQSLRADIARLAHPAPDVTDKTATGPAPKKKKAGKAAAKSPWSEYEQLAIARALAEGKHAYHIVMPIDPRCDMPIAARQMVRVVLDGLGEILAFYPVADSPAPMDRIEVAIASEQPAELILANCSIPTVVLNVQVRTLRSVVPSNPIPPTLIADPHGMDNSEGKNKEEDENNNIEEPASAAAPELPPAFPADEAPAAGEAIVAPVVPAGPDNLLRVDAERIDSVLNLVGELILAKSMLQQALLEFGQRFPKGCPARESSPTPWRFRAAS